jgi:hypothetical protein
MQLYRLNPEQKQVFLQQLQEVGQRLLNVSFSDPKADEANIRYHASLTGKFELLKLIIEDDFPETDHTTEG